MKTTRRLLFIIAPSLQKSLTQIARDIVPTWLAMRLFRHRIFLLETSKARPEALLQAT